MRSQRSRATSRSLLQRLLAGTIVLALTASLPAQDRDADLARVRDEIARLRQKLDKVRSETTTAEQELEAIELELAIQTREYQVAVNVQRELEAQRVALVDQIAKLSETIVQQKAYLSTRLAVLYRLGRLSYLRILLSMDRSRNPFEGMAMLAYLITRDARAVSRFQTTRERLEIRQADLADKQTRIERARLVVADRRAAISKTRKEKATLLAKLRSESYRSELRIAELEEKAKRLERLFALLYETNDPQVAHAANIAEFKGALDWPIRGEIIEVFGKQKSERFNTFTVSNGLKIQAAAGSDVRAVFGGTVLYSDWFKGYGNLVIVDHGSRIFSLYGNTRGVRVKTGERVDAGAVIALVAETEEGEHGHLYFEIREDNKPSDPQQWLR